MSNTEPVVIPEGIGPTPLAVEIHPVHYSDVDAFGTYIVIRGDEVNAILAKDGSMHFFFPPDGFKHLIKNLVEVLVFKPEEVNEQGEEVKAEAAAQGSDDSESL